MGTSERKRYEARQRMVVESVEAVLTDADADLFNITASLIADDPQGTAYAYAKFAASLVEELATTSGRTTADVLAQLGAQQGQSTRGD